MMIGLRLARIPCWYPLDALGAVPYLLWPHRGCAAAGADAYFAPCPRCTAVLRPFPRDSQSSLCVCLCMHQLAECAICLQGNCSGSAAHLQRSTDDVDAPALPLKPGQCLLLLDKSALSINDGRLWLDNVYFAAARHPPLFDTLAVSAGLSTHGLQPWSMYRQRAPLELYATNVTFQGAGDRSGRAFAFAPLSRGASILFQGTAHAWPTCINARCRLTAFRCSNLYDTHPPAPRM